MCRSSLSSITKYYDLDQLEAKSSQIINKFLSHLTILNIQCKLLIAQHEFIVPNSDDGKLREGVAARRIYPTVPILWVNYDDSQYLDPARRLVRNDQRYRPKSLKTCRLQPYVKTNIPLTVSLRLWTPLLIPLLVMAARVVKYY